MDSDSSDKNTQLTSAVWNRLPGPRAPWFGPAVMLVAFLLVFGLILGLTNANTHQAQRTELHHKSESVAERARLRLQGNQDYLLMLAQERSSGSLDADGFQVRASQYIKFHPELMNITWVDAAFFIRDVAPLAENRQIVGLQLNLPEPKRASRLAMRTRRPVYTRPFEAIQGKTSFEVWVPVYRGSTFLGLFGGVYSCERLMNQLASQGQHTLYHMSLVHASGGLLAELPVTGALDDSLYHSIPITPSDSGILLQTRRYRQQGYDWRVTALELLSLALVLAMAYTLWKLRLEIEERKRAEEALMEQAAQLELEVEERQMAQENLQEQAVILEEEISERRLAEEALSTSEEKLRLILDSTGEAIYGVDAHGLCTFCNTACVKMLGWNHVDDLLGKDMHLQAHHSHIDGTRFAPEGCRIKQAVVKGEAIHADNEVLWRSDGTCFAAEYWSYPQFKDGEVIGAVVTFIDITHRKELEEQIRQAQKMESIGRLAGGVAHDFNNMLSVILGAAQLSKAKLADGEGIVQYLDLIYKAATRSSEITRQLLAFSRKEVIRPKPVNLNAQILESEKMLERLINEDVKLSFRPSMKLWTVLIDPSQVDQILMNLAANARDAMPGGGSLVIETSNIVLGKEQGKYHPNAKPGEYVLLTVTDNGIGMDRQTREHIFEPFFTTKGVGEGTGLGLSTVYGIVSQNNGFINVFSEPGHGAAFKIYLPRLVRQEKEEDEGASAEPAVNGTVMLVEDEDMLLYMATKLLEEIGFRVIQAKNPQAAISICEKGEQQIDLILTDVIMPGMNGREMVERIKSVRPDTKVLFMSGYTADIVAQRGIVEKGMHFIQKPLEMNRLKDMVRQVLAQA